VQLMQQQQASLPAGRSAATDAEPNAAVTAG
jgi:hypothetical protein